MKKVLWNIPKYNSIPVLLNYLLNKRISITEHSRKLNTKRGFPVTAGTARSPVSGYLYNPKFFLFYLFLFTNHYVFFVEGL